MAVYFLRDWDKYPNAIVDVKTKNTTWVELARKYKAMGVKNYYFHLVLLNPRLQGVDPHDPNLTYDQKIEINIECSLNPWYYFRECFRVPATGSVVPVMFRANRANISLIWCFFNHITYFLMQPRQTGKSITMDGIILGLLYIWTDRSNINLVTKDNSLRVANIKRLKQMREVLPEYLWVQDKNDADNQNVLTYLSKKNNLNTFVGQSSIEGANKVGRGLTSAIALFDEGPFTNNISTIVPASLAGGNAAREIAKDVGAPYGTIFTTTAGKIDEPNGAYMYGIYQQGLPWGEYLLDSPNIETINDILDKNSVSKTSMRLINGTFSHTQLGFSDEWLIEQLQKTGATGLEADRDFFNKWTSGTQSNPIPIRILEAIQRSVMDPQYNEIDPDGYIFKWYIDELSYHRFKNETKIILTMDSSEMIDRDALALTAIDVRDLSVIGTGTYNKSNIISFSKWLAKFLIKNENMVFIFEKKSTGQAIFDVLSLEFAEAGINPFTKVYNRGWETIKEGKTVDHVLQSLMYQRGAITQRQLNPYKSLFGFNTSSKSRDLLYSEVLMEGTRKAGHLIHDSTLAQELKTLTVRNGRVDHAQGAHDDHVVSWLMGLWFLFKDPYHHYYNLDNSLVMSNVSDETRKLTPYELNMKKQQVEFQNELESLYEELRKAKDIFSISRIENKIRAISKKLCDTGAEPLNIAAVLKEAEKKRKEKNRLSINRNLRRYG